MTATTHQRAGADPSPRTGPSRPTDAAHDGPSPAGPGIGPRTDVPVAAHRIRVRRGLRSNLARRLAGDDRGEGVISAAIAVLIMAFLGAAMWVGFNQIWQNAETTTSDQVDQIGN